MLQSSAIDAPASQLLLVCCWRTMKEVALLLGELSENAPLQVDEINDGLLTVKQVIKQHFSTCSARAYQLCFPLSKEPFPFQSEETRNLVI